MQPKSAPTDLRLAFRAASVDPSSLEALVLCYLADARGPAEFSVAQFHSALADLAKKSPCTAAQ